MLRRYCVCATPKPSACQFPRQDTHYLFSPERRGTNDCQKVCPRCIRTRFGVESSNQSVEKNLSLRSLSKSVALLCLLLTFWSAITQFSHRHSDRTNESTCQVCVAAHSSSPKSATAAPKPLFLKILTPRRRPVAARQRLIAFALFVRPPPSV